MPYRYSFSVFETQYCLTAVALT